MRNYKKFMAEIDDRINKKKPKTPSKGLLGRGAVKEKVNDDYKEIIASYIAAIREIKEKVKKQNARKV